MAEIEMVIDSVQVRTPDGGGCANGVPAQLIDQYGNGRVLLLKEKEGERYLPIWVGPTEGDSISVKLHDVLVTKTPDFACSIIKALGSSVLNVIVNKLENNTFYAETCLERDGEITEIDCRPSYAVAMAIRTDAPIFVDEKVLNEAGVIP